MPDYWLAYGNPWEIERTDVQYNVCFGGHTKKIKDSKGKEAVVWVPGETVIARAYDNPLPGTYWIILLTSKIIIKVIILSTVLT